ncbi:MAG: hypothetical protein Q7R56_02910 [Nanoarchaeota archaeon]|nr:hypothetical protein [Nanoarchaeota archaeon]
MKILGKFLGGLSLVVAAGCGDERMPLPVRSHAFSELNYELFQVLSDRPMNYKSFTEVAGIPRMLSKDCYNSCIMVEVRGTEMRQFRSARFQRYDDNLNFVSIILPESIGPEVLTKLKTQ